MRDAEVEFMRLLGDNIGKSKCRVRYGARVKKNQRKAAIFLVTEKQIHDKDNIFRYVQT